MKKRKDTENNTFKSIFEEVQNHENDAIDNDVEYIDKLLYHKSEMVKFNHLAKTLKFDVNKLILHWLDKIKGIVN